MDRVILVLCGDQDVRIKQVHSDRLKPRSRLGHRHCSASHREWRRPWTETGLLRAASGETASEADHRVDAGLRHNSLAHGRSPLHDPPYGSVATAGGKKLVTAAHISWLIKPSQKSRNARYAADHLGLRRVSQVVLLRESRRRQQDASGNVVAKNLGRCSGRRSAHTGLTEEDVRQLVQKRKGPGGVAILTQRSLSMQAKMSNVDRLVWLTQTLERLVRADRAAKSTRSCRGFTPTEHSACRLQLRHDKLPPVG